MVRELGITFYLIAFKIIFNIFKAFPIQKKAAFVVSFADNSEYVYEEMLKQKVPYKSVFLKTKEVSLRLNKGNPKIIKFIPSNPFTFIQSIYHLATSEVVFLDNYYGFLSTVTMKKQTQIIQLWHANGAIKKFGWEDPSNQFRNEGAKRRFLKVYDSFNKVVVGSDYMTNIFMNAFQVSKDRILRIGVPRTDFFFNSSNNSQATSRVEKHYPEIKEKKVVLYAPTFREFKGELKPFELNIDISNFQKTLGDEYILLLRLHPSMNSHIKTSYPSIINVSSYPYINDLLLTTDILITDYSSIPFEFCLLKRPIIFFPFDLEEYKKERGFWCDFFELAPGPVVFNSEDLIKQITELSNNTHSMFSFSSSWNKYNNGNASKNLVNYIFKK
jgi:teichoic acid glycerol-phosphate primase